MKINKYDIHRDCKDPRFFVVVNCQGRSYYYFHHFLIGAVMDYIYQYYTKKRYGTFNFVLRQVLLTDEMKYV